MGTGESLVHSEFVRLLVGVEFKRDSEYVTAPPHQMVVHPVQEKTVTLVLVTWEYNAQCQWMGTGEHGNPLVVVQLHVVVVFKDTLVLVTALPLRRVEDIVLGKPPRPGVVEEWPAQSTATGVPSDHMVLVLLNVDLVRR